MTMLTDTLKVGIEVRRSPLRVALTFQALRSLDSLTGPPAGLWSTGVSPLTHSGENDSLKVQSRFSSLCLTEEA